MQVRVQFRPRRRQDQDVRLQDGATVGDLLRSLGEAPSTLLVVRGSTPVPEAEPLVAGETLLILSAFSGG